MKKFFITLICMAAMVCSLHAQKTIVGDMNDDGALNISDVTVLVNTILGKSPQREITGGGSDQTTLLGTWATSDGTIMQFRSAGEASITNNSAITSYEYFPSRGSLVFYDMYGSLVFACQVNSVSSTYLIVVEAGSTTRKAFYPPTSYATSISMSVSSAAMLAGDIPTSCRLLLLLREPQFIMPNGVRQTNL